MKGEPRVVGTLVGCAGRNRIAEPFEPGELGVARLDYSTLYILASQIPTCK
jgi:hypothetical protein